MGVAQSLQGKLLTVAAITIFIVGFAASEAHACAESEVGVWAANYRSSTNGFYNSSGVISTIQNIQNQLSATCSLGQPGNNRTAQIFHLSTSVCCSQIEAGFQQYRIDATTYDYLIFTEIQTPELGGIVTYFSKPCSINPRVGTSSWKIYLGQADGDWSLQMNCNDGTGWHSLRTYLDIGYAYGQAHSEISVFGDDAALDNVVTGLQYRLLDNVTWKNWIAVRCWFDNDDYWHTYPDTAKSWHAIYDAGSPIQNCDRRFG